MKRISLILLSVLSLFNLSASAEELMFYERPWFMTDALPVKIQCEMGSPYSGSCMGPYKAPPTIPVKAITRDGQNLQVVQHQPRMVVTCQLGICSSNRTKQPVGDVSYPQAEGSPVSLAMWDGYYLYLEADGSLMAYKRGFGPKADKYPPYALYTEPTQPMSTNTDPSAIDVVCMPQSDTCEFQGRTVDRNELRKLMPVKSTEWCDNEFCYATPTYEGVVGINPAGYL